MRGVLPGIKVWIDGRAAAASTTAGAVGGDAIVLGTAIPDFGLTLTSSCLVAADGATVAFTQRRLSPLDGDRFGHRELDMEFATGLTIAGACLLEHIQDARQLLLSHAAPGARVAVDVSDQALDEVSSAWAAAASRSASASGPAREWDGPSDMRTYRLPTALVAELDEYARAAGVTRSDAVAAGILSMLELELDERLSVVERAKFRARRRT